MEWQENNEIDSQRHIEPFPVKYGIDNQEHIEPTHEKSLSDDTIILDKSDCLKNKNSADMDILQDKTPSTDGSEIDLQIAPRNSQHQDTVIFYGKFKYK